MLQMLYSRCLGEQDHDLACWALQAVLNTSWLQMLLLLLLALLLCWLHRWLALRLCLLNL